MSSHLSVLIHRQVVQYNYNVNTLKPRQNGRHFADDTFKRIFLNENVRIPITISLKFVFKGLISNIRSLGQIMAWRRPGDKPLSEPMMVWLPTHLSVTRPQWVKHIFLRCIGSIRRPSGHHLNQDWPSFPTDICGTRGSTGPLSDLRCFVRRRNGGRQRNQPTLGGDQLDLI